MAKAYKVTLLIVDANGEVDEKSVKAVLENARYPNRCISPDVLSVQAADIGEWRDDHPLNNSATKIAAYQRLFP